MHVNSGHSYHTTSIRSQQQGRAGPRFGPAQCSHATLPGIYTAGAVPVPVDTHRRLDAPSP